MSPGDPSGALEILQVIPALQAVYKEQPEGLATLEGGLVPRDQLGTIEASLESQAGWILTYAGAWQPPSAATALAEKLWLEALG